MTGADVRDAVVIGAGHNGLVAAALLARAGLRTLVLERADVPGGCLRTESPWPGYRVDTGAHGFDALDPRLSSELDLGAHGLEVVDVDPCVRGLLPGGRSLTLRRDAAACAEEIHPFSEADARRWPEFVEATGRAARVLRVLYESPPPRLAGAERSDLWELAKLGIRVGRIGRADAVELMRLLPMTVEELLDEWFESEALKGLLAARGVLGVHQGPMAAGTAWVFLHGLVHGAVPRATRWARGGMQRVAEALASAAAAAGAEVRTGTPVERILVADGRARGVALASGEEIAADLVVSGADPGRTFRGLVDPLDLDPEFVRAVRNIRYRGAVAKVLLALDRLPEAAAGPAPALAVAPSIRYLERAHDAAKYGSVSGAPHLEAFLPSVLDPDAAPEGRHVMSVLVQYAPYRPREGPWDEAARERLGDLAVSTLDALAPGLRDSVVERHVLAPPDLEARFGITGGNIHHGEMMLDQAFIGRPVPGWSRYGTPIRGLYLCGAGTHPGGGVTGSPGLNSARMILAALSRGVLTPATRADQL